MTLVACLERAKQPTPISIINGLNCITGTGRDKLGKKFVALQYLRLICSSWI
jgi:hypothetical protein